MSVRDRAPEAAGVTTAEQLAKLDRHDARYELVEGELRMMSPSGGRHGRVAMKLAQRLANHVESLDLGVVYAAETGFILSRNPDTVRAPDVAFVSQPRCDQLGDAAGFIPFAPDLAAEVVSPTDTFSAVEEKAFGWLSAGTRLVLVVDPENRAVHAYRSAEDIVVLRGSDVLEAGDIVPKWQLKVDTLF